jgi:hypothetical protein
VWSGEGYALRSESADSLRSIRLGAGLMAFGGAAQAAIVSGVFVLVSQTGRDPSFWEMQVVHVLFATIFGLFLFAAVALRPPLRNRLDVLRRTLHNGFTVTVVGAMLAGSSFVLLDAMGVAKRMQWISADADGFGEAVAMVLMVGYGLWGHGCCVIAPMYMKRICGKPPIRPGSVHAIRTVAALFVAVLLMWSASRAHLFTGVNEVARAILGLVVLVAWVKAIAGVVHMFMLWHGVGKVLKSERRLAPHQ